MATQQRLFPTPPFDFARSLNFVGNFTPLQGEQGVLGQTLTRAVRVSGATVALTLRPGGTPERPELTCDLHAESALTPDTEQAALDRTRFFLSLDDDLRPFYTLAEGDPPFERVVRKLYGYHQVKFPTPFENACWAVLTQRAPPAAARQLKRRLTETFGGSVQTPRGVLWAFPEPADFGDVGKLGELLGNARKGEYLAAVVRAFQEVNEGWLRDAPYDEVKAWLLGIRGVGEWSAAFVLLRGLGRMERTFPSDGDGVFARELLRAAEGVYGDISFEELRAVAERYGPWQGYWAHYLRAAAS